MAERGGSEASFPVVFFDGITTTDLGCIVMKPSMNLQLFQSAVSQKTGISPNHITIYYERPSPAGGTRRTPVTNKFNFALILRDYDCFFLAVLNRPRRVRHRKNNRNDLDYPVHGGENSPEGNDLGFGDPNLAYAVADDYYRDHRSQMNLNSTQTSLNLNSKVYSDMLLGRSGFSGSDNGASSSGGVSSTGAAPVCEVCTRAKNEGQTAPFHLCNCDPILPTPFRSPFGPIARPAKTG